MPPTSACQICGKGKTIHGDCTYVALRWMVEGKYDIEYYPPFAVRLLRTCYLCGDAPSTHAEHRVPRTLGGSDSWANIGGACSACNMRQGHRALRLTADQTLRFENGQRQLLAAFTQVDEGVLAQALATRSRRRVYPSGDPFADQDRALLDMRVLMWDTGVSWEQIRRWLTVGLELMLARGWLERDSAWSVSDAVAEHVSCAQEDEADDPRHGFNPRPRYTARD